MRGLTLRIPSNEDTLVVYPFGVSFDEVSAVAVYKVNISLPPDLVAEIDAVVAERGLSRSGFIAEASARYLADLQTLSAEDLRKRDIDRAIADMRERGKKLPRDFDYVAAIRKAREERRIW